MRIERDDRGPVSGAEGRLRDIVSYAGVALLVTVSATLADRGGLFWDEYYHLLAARSWARDGTFAVGAGTYGRAGWLSGAVGTLFGLFGERVLVAKIAAALLVTVWCVAVFAWVRRADGRVTAWVAGVLMVTSPLLLVNGLMVRFYAVAGLLTTVGVILLDETTSSRIRGWTGVAAVVGASTCFYLSYRITSLTSVWVVGPILWSVLVAVRRRLWPRRGGLVYVAAAIVVAGTLWVAWSSGWLAENLATYRNAPGWSVDRAGDPRFYERMIRLGYPAVWALAPLIAAASLTRRFNSAAICLSTFGVAFLLLSGAAPKSERYLLPILPVFFVIVAFGAVELAPAIAHWIRGIATRRLPASASTAIHVWAGRALLLATLGGVLLVNPAISGIYEIWRGRLQTRDRPLAGALSVSEWDAAAPRIRELMADAEVVLTPNSVQFLYHVGGYDYAVRPSVVRELYPPEEFAVDARTGRPAISELASIQSVISQHSSGLVIGERNRWGHPFEGFTPEVVDWITANLTEVDTPPKLRAFRWDRGATR